MRNLHEIQQRPASSWRLVEPSLQETRDNPVRFAEQYLGGFLRPNDGGFRPRRATDGVADPTVAIPRAWHHIRQEEWESPDLHPAFQTLPMSEAVLRSWDMAIHALQAQHIQPDRANLMLSCNRAQWRAIMARFRPEEFVALFGPTNVPPNYRGVPVHVLPI